MFVPLNPLSRLKGDALYQPKSADLSALSALTAAGFVKRIGAGNFSSAVLDAADIPSLDASKIASGVLDAARVPFASPGAIGATTPAAGTFTTLTGASGAWALDAQGVNVHTPASAWLDNDAETAALTLTASGVVKDAQDTGTVTQSLGVRYTATKFTATSSYTVRGVEVWLRRAGSSTSWLRARIYSDNAGSPGVPLQTGGFYYFNNLSAGFSLTSLSISLALTNGTSYWLVIESSVNNEAEAYIVASGANDFATSADVTTWVLENDKRLRFRLVAGRRVGGYFFSTSSIGVRGVSANNVGVRGNSTNGIGVQGISTNNIGVRGDSANSIGLQGISTNSVGVRGDSTNGVGVQGNSINNVGVRGDSTNNIGLRGSSANSFGVYAYRNAASPTSAVPVFYVYQDHASDPNVAAIIRTDGAGDILRLSQTTDATVRWSMSALGVQTSRAQTSETAALVSSLILGVNSSSTPTNGFGLRIPLQLGSSTTNNRDAAAVKTSWVTATDASRASALELSVYSVANEQAGIRIEGDAGGAKIGFLGAAAVARASHIPDAAGGSTEDTEARTAINAVLAVLEGFGFIATS